MIRAFRNSAILILPVPKFIERLSPGFHIVQIASYEEMNPSPERSDKDW